MRHIKMQSLFKFIVLSVGIAATLTIFNGAFIAFSKADYTSEDYLLMGNALIIAHLMLDRLTPLFETEEDKPEAK